MNAARPFLGLLGLFFTAGALLLMFLTLLGGVTNTTPLNEIYFLQANTGNIPGAPALSRWTFWNICGVNGTTGRSVCDYWHADFPLDPPSGWNFNTTINVPSGFIGTSHYYYMTRFMFPFMIIALAFAVGSLFTGLLALCTRIGGYISAFLAWLGLTFQTLTAALMTAAYVQGRDQFRHNGQPASLGRMAFGFMWAAVACLFLSCVLYCIGGSVGRRDAGYSGRRERRRGFFGSRSSTNGEIVKEPVP